MPVDRPTRKMGARGTPAHGKPSGPPSPPPRRAGPPSRGGARPPARSAREEEPEEQSAQELVDRHETPPPRVREDIKPAGLPLGIKFALMIAGTVALASLILILFARERTSNAMNDEINDAGVRMVRVLACVDLSTWEEMSTHKSTIEFINKINGALKKFGEDLTAKKPNSDEATKFVQGMIDDINKLGAELGKYAEGLSSDDPLSRAGNPDLAQMMKVKNPDVLDLAILNAQNGAVCQMNKGSKTVSMRDQVKIGEADDVKIVEGYYSSDAYSGRTRSFTKPILSKTGSSTGTVVLFLRASKIDDVQSKMTTALFIPGALAVAIGAVVGFFLAGFVTKPVKTLIRDIMQVAEGDLEHQTKATSKDEIGIVAKAFDSMTKSLKVAHQAELQTKALEHELNIATEIQSNLLPKKIPKIPGFDVSAYYRPSKEVGGDYYDFIPIDADNLGIVVADVSGKGIPGSMVMTMARSLLRMEAERNLSTADTLVKTNRILAKDIRRGMFVTAMYMILNVKNRTLLVSSAGHNPLHVYRAKTKSFDLVNPNGIALGFDKGPIFERTVKEQRIQLYPGDRFSSYTDGVVEAMSINDEEFGDDKFFNLCQELATKESNQFINVIVKALDEHKGDREQHDDITLVTFRLLP